MDENAGVRGRQTIARHFESSFGRWGIRLPPDSVERGEPGHVFKAGWHIGFRWGTEGEQVLLEYLAQHRMTDDRRVRLRESGRREALPAPSSMIVYPSEAGQQDRDRICRAHTARHRKLCAELRAQGLLPPRGHNLPALELNEILRSGGMTKAE